MKPCRLPHAVEWMNVQLQRYPIRNDPGVILTHPATSAAVDDAGREPAGVVAMTATSRLRPGARSISGLCCPNGPGGSAPDPGRFRGSQRSLIENSPKFRFVAAIFLRLAAVYRCGPPSGLGVHVAESHRRKTPCTPVGTLVRAPRVVAVRGGRRLRGRRP